MYFDHPLDNIAGKGRAGVFVSPVCTPDLSVYSDVLELGKINKCVQRYAGSIRFSYRKDDKGLGDDSDCERETFLRILLKKERLTFV